MTDLWEDGSGEAWTDEKHTSFINWMEASFVSCMLLGGRFANPAGARRRATPLPLDRYLPDGADSTVDCRTGKRGRQSTAAHPREGRSGVADGLRRTRKRLHTSPDSQDDQVVPGFDGTKGGENVRPLSDPEVVQPAATDDQFPTE